MAGRQTREVGPRDVADSVLALIGQVRGKKLVRTTVTPGIVGADPSGAAGGGQSNPLTDSGQLIVGGPSGVQQRLVHPGAKGYILVTLSPTTVGWLAPGLANQVLTMLSGMPTWAYPVSELGAEPDYTVVASGLIVGASGAYVTAVP